MKTALVLACLLALSACGDKFETGTRGPEPVPYKGEWRNYGEMPDFDVWVDVDSISHNDRFAPDQYTYVWMRQNFKRDQVDGVSKGTYRIKYARVAIDCKSGRMAETAAELRDENDGDVARYDVPGYQWEFSTPQTDSYGADFVRQVCKIMASKDAAENQEE
ncbi:surface-adhesin E family protein [Chitinolyticbacter meiyuanensis]|uniref:surface-adhesin E family protein n=1 Tax=Chitinolyticbacter meiyuanensis TaxID=682798 RepID=UPI0011E5DF80|nr:surface-adhesin E family protein [Chitinolyticbacter meiyuanensis]